MANTKEIQRRIKSVNNTKKITKAMEMVAASKMRKAVEGVLKTRTYANLSWTMVINLSKAINCSKETHVLMSARKAIKRVAIVLMASNRGLCGGFNSAILNKAHDSVIKHLKNINGEKIETDFIVVGKKGMSINSRFGHKVIAQFQKLDICSEVSEVMPISRMVTDEFINQKYDKILVAYTDFVSAVSQVPRVKQLLPIDITAEKDHYLGVVGKDSRVGINLELVKEKEGEHLHDGKKKDSYVFTFEPNAKEVLEQMIPRLIEVQLFQALLESNASEHSARMASMHQATDAAKDLVEQLTLYYNKARQAAITSEIAEISAGADALAE